MCNALGISILWRNKLAENGIFQFATTMTDFGLCCNILLKYDEKNNMTKPRSGNIFFLSLNLCHRNFIAVVAGLSPISSVLGSNQSKSLIHRVMTIVYKSSTYLNFWNLMIIH